VGPRPARALQSARHQRPARRSSPRAGADGAPGTPRGKPIRAPQSSGAGAARALRRSREARAASSSREARAARDDRARVLARAGGRARAAASGV